MADGRMGAVKVFGAIEQAYRGPKSTVPLGGGPTANIFKHGCQDSEKL